MDKKSKFQSAEKALLAIYARHQILYRSSFFFTPQRPAVKFLGRIFFLCNLAHALYAAIASVRIQLTEIPVKWEIAMQTLFEFAFILTIIITYMIFLSFDTQIQSNHARVIEYIKSFVKVDEIQVIVDICNSYDQLSDIFVAIIYGSYIGFAVVPTLIILLANSKMFGNHNYTRLLCTTGELFLDREKYFYYWYTYTILMMTFLATVVSAEFCCGIYFISINLSIFGLVRYRLKKVQKLITNEFNPSIDRQSLENIHLEIRNIVINHTEAIQFFWENQEFSDKILILLSIYVLCALSSTGILILIALKTGNLFLLMEMTVAFIFVILFSFLMGHVGQLISNASSEIFENTYSCGWYDFSNKTKQLIHLMLIRSNRPCELQSGPSKILKMNYVNFTAIVKTAVSYVTVMASLMH